MPSLIDTQEMVLAVSRVSAGAVNVCTLLSAPAPLRVSVATAMEPGFPPPSFRILIEACLPLFVSES